MQWSGLAVTDPLRLAAGSAKELSRIRQGRTAQRRRRQKLRYRTTIVPNRECRGPRVCAPRPQESLYPAFKGLGSPCDSMTLRSAPTATPCPDHRGAAGIPRPGPRRMMPTLRRGRETPQGRPVLTGAGREGPVAGSGAPAALVGLRAHCEGVGHLSTVAGRGHSRRPRAVMTRFAGGGGTQRQASAGLPNLGKQGRIRFLRRGATNPRSGISFGKMGVR